MEQIVDILKKQWFTQLDIMFPLICKQEVAETLNFVVEGKNLDITSQTLYQNALKVLAFNLRVGVLNPEIRNRQFDHQDFSSRSNFLTSVKN